MSNPTLDLPISPSTDTLRGFFASFPGMACQIELHRDGTVSFPQSLGHKFTGHSDK